MSLDQVELAAGLPGPITARVRMLGDRRVSMVEFERMDPAAPLTANQTTTLEVAVRTAYEERIPLVAVM